MKKQIESVVLENKSGQRLRIYQVDGEPVSFCIGIEGGSNEHFEFDECDAKEIIASIDLVVDRFV